MAGKYHWGGSVNGSFCDFYAKQSLLAISILTKLMQSENKRKNYAGNKMLPASIKEKGAHCLEVLRVSFITD